jgi:hypothetical protein
METDDMVFVENIPSMTLISPFRKHPNEHPDQLPEFQSKMSDNRDYAPYSTPREAEARLDHGNDETETGKHPIENRAGSWRQWQDGRSMDHSLDSDVSKTPLGTHRVVEQGPVGGRRLPSLPGLPFHAKISHSGSENRALSSPPPVCHHLPLATNECSQIPQQPVPPPVR